MKRASDDRLSVALHAAGLHGLAARAAKGEFNDFFSDEHAYPKIELVNALREAGPHPQITALIKRVMDGEFDSGREEREEWRNSDEGRRIRDLLA